MTEKHGTATAVALSAVILMAAMVGCLGTGPDAGDGAKEDGVTLVIDFEGFDPGTLPGVEATWTPGTSGGWSVASEPTDGDTVYTVLNVTGKSVLDVLVAAGEAGGFPVVQHREAQGAFVDSIDGVANGADDHFWSYYVNDEYGLVSSDAAGVSDGDTVRWVYMGNPFG